MKARTILLIALMCVACETQKDSYPLDLNNEGITALRWGMSPDEVRPHMLEMQGVGLTRDTMLSIPGGYYPGYLSPDTVQVRLAPEPPRSVRWVEFKGGRFLGYDASGWMLLFTGSRGLIEVTVALKPDDRNKRRRFLLESAFDDRFGPAVPFRGGHVWRSVGFVGSPDTNQAWDTRISTSQMGHQMLSVRFGDIGDDDSLSAWYDAHPLQKMHISEYNAWLRKQGIKPE